MGICDYKNFTRDGPVEPIRDKSGEMNSGRKTPIELVVSGDDARVHWRGKRQNDGRRSEISIPAGGQMKDDQPAGQIAQRMDFCRRATALGQSFGSAPPFPVGDTTSGPVGPVGR